MNRYRVSFDRSTDLYVETIVPHGRYCLAEDATDQLAAAQARIAELEQHILMLTKLPTWKPVEDGFTHLCGCIDCTGEDPDGWGWQLYVNHNGIGIADPDDAADNRWVLLPNDLRLCRFTPVDWVDWEKVPEGFDWAAADGDRKCWAFTSQPEQIAAGWIDHRADYPGYLRIPGTLPLGIDWRQSLRRRPTT